MSFYPRIRIRTSRRSIEACSHVAGQQPGSRSRVQNVRNTNMMTRRSESRHRVSLRRIKRKIYFKRIRKYRPISSFALARKPKPRNCRSTWTRTSRTIHFEWSGVSLEQSTYLARQCTRIIPLKRTNNFRNYNRRSPRDSSYEKRSQDESHFYHSRFNLIPC